jgi:predicted pyridoxine 5'-phosphate oxidase superfamily flavin-nucleotide-binding protein
MSVVRLTDDMKRIVLEQRLGYAATVCADGTPNLSPKGTTTVFDDEHLMFADIHSPGHGAKPAAKPGNRTQRRRSDRP